MEFKTFFQGLIYDKSAMFQLVTWHQTGNKLVPESMMMFFGGVICKTYIFEVGEVDAKLKNIIKYICRKYLT